MKKALSFCTVLLVLFCMTGIVSCDDLFGNQNAFHPMTESDFAALSGTWTKKGEQGCYIYSNDVQSVKYTTIIDEQIQFGDLTSNQSLPVYVLKANDTDIRERVDGSTWSEDDIKGWKEHIESVGGTVTASDDKKTVTATIVIDRTVEEAVEGPNNTMYGMESFSNAEINRKGTEIRQSGAIQGYSDSYCEIIWKKR